MSLSKAQRVRLGGFVASGLAVAVLLATTVVGTRFFEKVDTYPLTYPGNVSGLEVGSDVRYQGLRVGSVESMGVSPEDPSAIRIELALDPSTRLFEGTEAVLEFSGITGLKTINLIPGDPRNEVMKPGTPIPPGSSFIQRISGEAEIIAQKVERLMNQLLGFSSPVNQRRFEEILSNVAGLTEKANRLLGDVEEPAREAIERVNRVTRSVTETSDRVGRAVLALKGNAAAAMQSTARAMEQVRRVLSAVDRDSVRSIVKRTDAIATRIDQELARSELAETLEEARVALDRLTQMLDEVDLVVRAGRQDLLLSLRAVKESTENLREFTQLISRDPSLILRGASAGK